MVTRLAAPQASLRRFTVAALLLGLSAHAAAAPPPAGNAGRFDPQRVGWTRLEFEARKLFLSAHASMSAGQRERDSIAMEIVSPATGKPVAVPAIVAEIRYGASGIGRNSETTLWLDVADGAAVQRMQLDRGKRTRHRIYRYTDVGAWHQTRWPASEQEIDRPPEQWTERSEGLRAYPPTAAGLPIADPAALLWLIAASDLAQAGDSMALHTFSRRQVHRVAVEVLGPMQASIDFDSTDSRGAWQRRGKMPALRLRIRGEPLQQQQGDDDEFELLGLQGDIELLLDPAHRTPLALSGKGKIVGQVTFHLRRAVLR
jgi:hypothetical protein